MQGLLPAPVVAIIVGRDVILVLGAVYLRFRALHGRPGSMADFFRISQAAGPMVSVGAAAHAGEASLSSKDSSAQQAVNPGLKDRAEVLLGAQDPDQAGEHFGLHRTGSHRCA